MPRTFISFRGFYNSFSYSTTSIYQYFLAGVANRFLTESRLHFSCFGGRALRQHRFILNCINSEPLLDHAHYLLPQDSIAFGDKYPNYWHYLRRKPDLLYFFSGFCQASSINCDWCPLQTSFSSGTCFESCMRVKSLQRPGGCRVRSLGGIRSRLGWKWARHSPNSSS